MKKSDIRNTILSTRKNRYDPLKKINFNIIKDFISNNISKPVIGGYVPVNYEIDCLKILKKFENEKIKISLPVIKNNKDIKKFEDIGADIGLLFQVADDLIDNQGTLLVAGKKTGKDRKQGKATLISLLGHKNTIKYADKLILKIKSKLKRYGSKSKNLFETLEYILNRNK